MNANDIKNIEMIVAQVASFIPVFGGLVSGVITMVSQLDIIEEDKDALIKRIRDAQAAIPEWK